MAPPIRGNPPAEATISALAEQFASCFREHLRPIRKVGLEAEFPLVRPDGRAGDVAWLWDPLRAGGGFAAHYDDPASDELLVSLQRGDVTYAAEVGRGTVEISLGPYDDLWELDAAYRAALTPLREAASACGFALLGTGIQPRTPASLAQMTPRRHYQALYGAIGKAWLPLTTTAASQLHVDICRSELLDAINWLNLLSGAIIALCANSAVYGGRAGQYLSGREGLLRGLGEFRYGMTPRRFASVEDYVRYLCDYPCFVLSRATGYRPFNRPFTDYLRQLPTTSRQSPTDAFLWHEHYVWNSARARVAASTIEIRPACQQPPGEPLAAAALGLGLAESLPQLAAFAAERLGPDPWPAMAAYRRTAVREGLAAPEPAPGFLQGCVTIAQSGLERRGRGEAAFLSPIWQRLERRESPGQGARNLLKREGMAGLLEWARLRV